MIDHQDQGIEVEIEIVEGSSNDRYSRSSSRSPDRGSYDRRSYSSYRDNSRDKV